MTRNQRLIWASVFAVEYHDYFSDESRGIREEEKRSPASTKTAAIRAAVVATQAVEALESGFPWIEDKFGSDHKYSQCSREMIKGDSLWNDKL